MKVINPAWPSRQPENQRRYKLWSRYKITPEQLAERLAGPCDFPSCSRPAVHVDHDHHCCPGRATCGGCLRGTLCSEHNRGMGFFGDDPEQLREAITYLEGWA